MRIRLLTHARQTAGSIATRAAELSANEISGARTDQVFSITRKTLRPCRHSLEERITKVFTRRLRELDGEAKQGLAKALTASSEPACVRSAFELPAEQQTRSGRR
jgi:F-type H+-transporting ATPase subunit b